MKFLSFGLITLILARTSLSIASSAKHSELRGEGSQANGWVPVGVVNGQHGVQGNVHGGQGAQGGTQIVSDPKKTTTTTENKWKTPEHVHEKGPMTHSQGPTKTYEYHKHSQVVKPTHQVQYVNHHQTSYKTITHEHHHHDKLIHNEHYHQHIVHQNNLHKVHLHNHHTQVQHVHNKHHHKLHVHQPIYHTHPNHVQKETEEHRHRNTQTETHKQFYQLHEKHSHAPAQHYQQPGQPQELQGSHQGAYSGNGGNQVQVIQGQGHANSPLTHGGHTVSHLIQGTYEGNQLVPRAPAASKLPFVPSPQVVSSPAYKVPLTQVVKSAAFVPSVPLPSPSRSHRRNLWY